MCTPACLSLSLSVSVCVCAVQVDEATSCEIGAAVAAKGGRFLEVRERGSETVCLVEGGGAHCKEGFSR